MIIKMMKMIVFIKIHKTFLITSFNELTNRIVLDAKCYNVEIYKSCFELY